MSKIYQKIYSTTIDSILFSPDGSFNVNDLEQVMYRVINLNDQFLFAEEIATGCIFPCYTWMKSEANRCIMLKEYSNLFFGKYFLFVGTSWQNKFGKVVFDDANTKEAATCPTIEEINDYLEKKQNNSYFKAKMMEYEIANTYMCDFKTIKDEIAKLKAPSNLQEKDSNYTPACDISVIKNFGYDLSEQDELCHAIGRDEILERVIESTIIKGKSILLIGEAGCGKTAIVEELAREIKMGTNEWLVGKMIISVNANSLVAGTKYRGEFEEKMNELIKFARSNKGKVILFIDEIHALYGLGTAEENKNNDAVNILKPFLSNRDIVVIGATTSQEYVENIVPDAAFCGRFDKVNIKELSLELKIDILLEFLLNLSENHGVNFNFSDPKALITRVLSLTDLKHQVSFNEARISNIRLSKDIFEDAFAHVKYKKRDVVEEADVIEALTKCDRISTIVRRKETMYLQNVLATANAQIPQLGKIVSLEKLRSLK